MVKKVTDQKYLEALEVVKVYKLAEKQTKIEAKKKENANILGKYFKYVEDSICPKTTFVFVEKIIDEDNILVKRFVLHPRSMGSIDYAMYDNSRSSLVSMNMKNEITKEQYENEIKNWFRSVLDELEIDLRK